MTFKENHKIILYLVCYFLISFLGADFSTKVESIIIWPAAGMALGILLILGLSYWPIIFFADVFSFILNGYPVNISLLIGLGNMLTAISGMYLVNRQIGADFFNTIGNVLKFILYAGILSPIVSTIFAVLSWKMGVFYPHGLWCFIFEWWFAQVAGIIILSPLILTWVQNNNIIWNYKKRLEYIALLILIAFTSYLIFNGQIGNNPVNALTYKYLLLPYYFWLIYWYSQREIATTTALVAIIGIWSTYDIGIVDRTTVDELILSSQFFLCFIMATALILSAIVNERRQMMENIARFERLNLVGEMAASFAHELRNPITVVRGYIQLLSNRPEQKEQKEVFTTIINEIDRANSIITEYLLLAKNRNLDLKRKNINKIIQVLFPLMQADAIHSNKSIDIKLGDIPEFLLDENEIRQLILNFVKNSLEAMGPSGILNISTYMHDNKVVLVFKDQGKGIPKDLIPKLGTPFFTTKKNGTGLGLAVSYSIAARHNAVINVESNAKSTTFSVSFDPI